jgi:chromate transporter
MSLVLLQLIGLFAVLSMLAFGGGSGVIPDMQRAAVDRYHWLTAREFLDMFAISRAAPGPGSLIVVLIGLKAAGLAGAAVSSFG